MKDVIVIGAGISGLCCARSLQAAGKQVILLEGRNRIGGRMDTVPWPLDGETAQIDLGAQYIHCAVKRNPIKQLADKLKLNYHRINWDDGYYYEGRPTTHLDGGNESYPRKQTSKKRLKEAYALYDKALARMQRSRKGKSDRPWGEAFEEELRKLNSPDSELTELTQRIATMDIASDFAADLEDLSLLYWDQTDEYVKDNDAVIQHCGYRSIVDHLAKDLIIHTDTIVSEIDFVSSNSTAMVSCTSGSQWVAKQVVVTIPLGVLKANHQQLFRPSLPTEVETSIQNIGFGIFEKVILTFHERFWETDVDCFYNTSGNPFSVWLLPGRLYHEKVLDRTLLCFVTGTYAQKLWNEHKGMDCNGDSEIVAEALASLREIFGPRVIPNEKEAALELVKAHVVTRWCQDPFAMGSYSTNVVGSTLHDFQTFQKPYMNGRLVFAGEATHSTLHSTVHGAFVSGEQAAQICLNA